MAVKVQKRNGAWYVFIYHDGKRKARRIGTRQAAEEVRRKIEARLAAGEFLFEADPDEPRVPTFKQYSDKWLKEFAEVSLKHSTVSRHKQLLNSYLLPRFGDLEITKIIRDDLKSFLAGYATESRLSRNSVRLILSCIRTILNHAIEDSLIQSNPAARLGRFLKSEKPKRKAQAMTREEAERFLAAVLEAYPRFWALFLTALRAGLRRGELVALQWGDIEFGANDEDENRYIVVQRNYVRGFFTTPKSRKSRRVDMSRQLRTTLLGLRQQREVEAMKSGKASILDDFVFPSEVGTVMNPDNIYHRYFLPSLEKAKLRRFRLHDLRHTFGSLLIQDGASLAYVKEQMGHSSIQVTVDTYGHLIPGANISWIDRLDEKSSRSKRTAPQPAEPKAVAGTNQLVNIQSTRPN
jgi:integrase